MDGTRSLSLFPAFERGPEPQEKNSLSAGAKTVASTLWPWPSRYRTSPWDRVRERLRRLPMNGMSAPPASTCGDLDLGGRLGGHQVIAHDPGVVGECVGERLLAFPPRLVPACATNSAGIPTTFPMKYSAASPRRPSATIVSYCSTSAGGRAAGSRIYGGSHSASLFDRRAARRRDQRESGARGRAPEVRRATGGLDHASMSSISRSMAYGRVSPLSPRPRRS